MWKSDVTALAVVLLLLCWAAGGAAAPPPRTRCNSADMFCSTRVVVNMASFPGKLENLVEDPQTDQWVDPGVMVDTPAHGQVFKIAPNQITASGLDTKREFVTFHVLYDDTAVNVEFNYGVNVDVTGSWCTGLPDHPMFAGEACQPGHSRRSGSGKVGGVAAYLVSATTTAGLKDSGAMRDPGSSICYWARSLSNNTAGAQRCVYLRAISLADGAGPAVYVGNQTVGSEVIRAFVGNRNDVPPTEQGYELRVEVRASMPGATLSSPGSLLPLVIESRTIGESAAELPGQRWLGPTVCMETGSTEVSSGGTTGPCKTWHRVLAWSPSTVLKNRKFEFAFQAVTKFPEPNEFFAPAYAGVACAGKLGACPNGTEIPEK